MNFWNAGGLGGLLWQVDFIGMDTDLTGSDGNHTMYLWWRQTLTFNFKISWLHVVQIFSFQNCFLSKFPSFSELIPARSSHLSSQQRWGIFCGNLTVEIGKVSQCLCVCVCEECHLEYTYSNWGFPLLHNFLSVLIWDMPLWGTVKPLPNFGKVHSLHKLFSEIN